MNVVALSIWLLSVAFCNFSASVHSLPGQDSQTDAECIKEFCHLIYIEVIILPLAFSQRLYNTSLLLSVWSARLGEFPVVLQSLPLSCKTIKTILISLLNCLLVSTQKYPSLSTTLADIWSYSPVWSRLHHTVYYSFEWSIWQRSSKLVNTPLKVR